MRGPCEGLFPPCQSLPLHQLRRLLVLLFTQLVYLFVFLSAPRHKGRVPGVTPGRAQTAPVLYDPSLAQCLEIYIQTNALGILYKGPHSSLSALTELCREIPPAVVECVVGVVLETSLVGEVTPPCLRGEGDNRVRGNNLKMVKVVIKVIVVVMTMMVPVT